MLSCLKYHHAKQYTHQNNYLHLLSSEFIGNYLGEIVHSSCTQLVLYSLGSSKIIQALEDPPSKWCLYGTHNEVETQLVAAGLGLGTIDTRLSTHVHVSSCGNMADSLSLRVYSSVICSPSATADTMSKQEPVRIATLSSVGVQVRSNRDYLDRSA